MSEKISLKMGVKFAASLNMGENLGLVLLMMRTNYSQHKAIPIEQKVGDCEYPL